MAVIQNYLAFMWLLLPKDSVYFRSPQLWTFCLPLYNSNLKEREIQEVVKSGSHLGIRVRETRYAFMKWLGNNPRKNLVVIEVIKQHVICNLAVKWSLGKLDIFNLKKISRYWDLGQFLMNVSGIILGNQCWFHLAPSIQNLGLWAWEENFFLT